MTTTSAIRPIKITNTLTGKKEPLETFQAGKLSFYSCGPTVYGFIHIGNLRGGLVADMFYRYFKRVGYEVNYVRNYTDVEDKIIKRAAEEKITAEEVARKYTLEAEKDYAVAGMAEPTHKPSVTGHMPEIVAMIQDLVKKGKAYAVSGEVLYSIEKFEGYGKLSHKQIEDLQAGIRVDINDKKKNPLDFTLWKPAKPGEPSWDSPWGKGRPGWHIECSAMAKRWIGDQVDVHHGGVDLIFPHHENEIAQSEGCSGKTFVKYWMHHAFLTLSKTKMSKSLGNVFQARDFLTQYSGEFARFLLVGVHYRSPIDFDDSLIEQTITGLERIYEAKAKARQILGQSGRARADLRAEGAWGSFLASCESARKEIDDCYANDFNTAGALGALFTLIREFNRTLAEPLSAATPAAALGAQQLVQIMEEDIGGIIGVGRLDPGKAMEDLSRIKTVRAAATGSALPTEAEILAAIEQRKAARAAKDFAKADQLRKDLEARGVLIKDSPTGTTWSYK